MVERKQGTYEGKRGSAKNLTEYWNRTYTGAMYSSVPTKELDCEIGSATNVGGGSLLDLLFLDGGCFITWNSIHKCKCVTNIIPHGLRIKKWQMHKTR